MKNGKHILDNTHNLNNMLRNNYILNTQKQ